MITAERNREVWVDWMRVIACLMVMVVHCTEPFYLGGDGAQVLTEGDAIWVALIDAAMRMCVPLFVVGSAYLQFPTRYSTGAFLKRRTLRIVVPFAVWSVFYALYWGEPVENFQSLMLNFNYSAGHLWFVYMLLGVYVLIPLLSPWAKTVKKGELQVYIGIWLLTTLLPLVRDWAMTDAGAMIYGPTGIPRQALYPLWGEASWNTYGTFYYMSGFVGFLLLGLYFRRFVPTMSARRSLLVGMPLWLVGFGISAGGVLRRIYQTSGGDFPALGTLDVAVWWETTINYDTLGVALMTMGGLLMLRTMKLSGGVYRRIVLPLSKAGYGMYLSHMVVLSVVISSARDMWGLGADGAFGIFTTPVQIVVSAAITFAVVGLCSVFLQRIPKIGEWIMG